MSRAIPILATLPLLVLAAGPWASAAENRRALLVGCSQYVHYPDRPLPGAANDAENFRRLLKERFAFGEDEMISLIGWPDDASKRPTFKNICAAFENLIARAGAGDQVVVYLSGHGCLRLLDQPDPSEPDGYDEAFVPADQEMGGKVILDNQVGDWLEKLNQKNAHVWIIFDSCFSGTMTRGGANAGPVVSRGLAPSPKRPPSPDGQFDGLDIPGESPSQASLVAFYAAQEFEEAVEVIRPIGADSEDIENRHGLLSYHIEQALRQRDEAITYGELGRMLVSRYRADKRRRPTPFFEGDLDHEVLGLKQWPPAKPLYLERAGESVRLSAGEFAGVSVGAVLAVFQLDDKERQSPIGHVRVIQTTATAANVESVAFGRMKALEVTEFPDNAFCQIVSQDWGDHRLKVAISSLSDSNSADVRGQFESALRPLFEKLSDVVSRVDEEQSAEWVLAAIAPDVASSRFGMKVDEPAVMLVPGELALTLSDAEPRGASSPQTPPLKAPVHYPLSALQKNTLPLEQDLQKIFTWHNVWRVAGAYGEGSPLGGRRRIRLEVETSRGPAASRLTAGDSVAVRVVNSGYEQYWYTVLFLNERFGIQHVKSHSIERRESVGPARKHDVLRFNVSSKLSGTNGFVIIAVSRKEHPNQPNYRFLDQKMLGVSGTRDAPDTSQLTTPFEQMLLGAMAGGSSFRSSVSPDKPQLASWSWVTVQRGSP